MMDILTGHRMSRRCLLAGTGSLIVSFSTIGALAQGISAAAPEKPKLPGSLDDDGYLDSWIRIDADGTITVFTGKVELGQGIRTALIQVAAEELEVDPADIALVTADTGRTPDEGFTAGSQSMQNSGTAIRNAAAQVRELLITEAARRFNLPPDQLRAKKKSVFGPQGSSATYGELVSGQFLHVQAQPQSKLKQPDGLSIIGRDVQRIDIPGKVTGAAAYVQDLRLEGMVHARVIRPPSYGATLKDIDATAAAAMPGVISVIRDGSFLAVVAEKEWQAVKAMRAVEKSGAVGRACNASRTGRSGRRSRRSGKGCRHRGRIRQSELPERPYLRGNLHAPLSDARFDRSVLCARASEGRRQP
ncbi:aldehyde oxidase/xanthine dehydrogenase-like protein [Rhizobium azibense]|uniref:Aldehyde oxidase/xanthine dehydrogenase-like protein n=1 Tax=Rhizobium azibense TaxID=1136135 RepID=A0A4R3S3N4_9HYPH|nr:aldehyde oxidase/xanthine dehydrogenase-like protein [Rhizobium azibense]